MTRNIFDQFDEAPPEQGQRVAQAAPGPHKLVPDEHLLDHPNQLGVEKFEWSNKLPRNREGRSEKHLPDSTWTPFLKDVDPRLLGTFYPYEAPPPNFRTWPFGPPPPFKDQKVGGPRVPPSASKEAEPEDWTDRLVEGQRRRGGRTEDGLRDSPWLPVKPYMGQRDNAFNPEVDWLTGYPTMPWRGDPAFRQKIVSAIAPQPERRSLFNRTFDRVLDEQTLAGGVRAPESNVPWGTPNVEAAAYRQRGPGIFGKVLGALGLDASGKRTETSWSDAAETTAKGGSIANLVHDAAAAGERLLAYKPGAEDDPYREQAPIDALAVSGAAMTGSLIGARPRGSLGTFIGRPQAENMAKAGRPIPLAAMNLAEHLEAQGASAEAIRTATNALIERHDPELRGVWKPPEWRGLKGEEPKPGFLVELSDHDMRFLTAHSEMDPGISSVDSAVHHPELFTADPGLRDVALVGRNNPPGVRRHASYAHPDPMGEGEAIGLGLQSSRLEEAFLHESQHRQSRLAGLSAGSSPQREFAALPDIPLEVAKHPAISGLMNEITMRVANDPQFKGTPAYNSMIVSVQRMIRFEKQRIARENYSHNPTENVSTLVEARRNLTPGEGRRIDPDTHMDVPAHLQDVAPRARGNAQHFEQPAAGRDVSEVGSIPELPLMSLWHGHPARGLQYFPAEQIGHGDGILHYQPAHGDGRWRVVTGMNPNELRAYLGPELAGQLLSQPLTKSPNAPTVQSHTLTDLPKFQLGEHWETARTRNSDQQQRRVVQEAQDREWDAAGPNKGDISEMASVPKGTTREGLIRTLHEHGTDPASIAKIVNGTFPEQPLTKDGLQKILDGLPPVGDMDAIRNRRLDDSLRRMRLNAEQEAREAARGRKVDEMNEPVDWETDLWDSMGRHGTAGEQALERSKQRPARAQPENPSLLGHAARGLTQDVRNLEAEMKGRPAEVVAAAIQDRFGFSVDPADLVSGNVWWREPAAQRARKQWTEPHIAELERLWNASTPVAEMAARMSEVTGRDVTSSAIAAVTFQNRGRFPSRNNFVMIGDHLAEVQRMYEAGATHAEIQKHLGTIIGREPSVRTVSYAIAKLRDSGAVEARAPRWTADEIRVLHDPKIHSLSSADAAKVLSGRFERPFTADQVRRARERNEMDLVPRGDEPPRSRLRLYAAGVPAADSEKRKIPLNDQVERRLKQQEIDEQQLQRENYMRRLFDLPEIRKPVEAPMPEPGNRTVEEPPRGRDGRFKKTRDFLFRLNTGY